MSYETGDHLKNKPQAPKDVGHEHEEATLYPCFARRNMAFMFLDIMVMKEIMIPQETEMGAFVYGKGDCPCRAK